MDHEKIDSEAIGPDSDLELDSDEEEMGNEVTDSPQQQVSQPVNHFNWKKEDPNNVQYQAKVEDFVEPDETFKLEENQLEPELTPFKALNYFMNDDIVSTILSQTNTYAELLRRKKPNSLKTWKPLAESEFWKFFGLHLLMGLVKKNTMNDYWSKNLLLQTPIFGQTMPRDRFIQILSCFHLADNSNPSPNNKLWKLGNIIPQLKLSFKNLINVGEYLSVDESLLPFKGRLGFKQYNPLKRARFGIKYFGIVDCNTKYLSDFEIYVGKCTDTPTELEKKVGLGGSVVLKLLGPYQQKNHKLVVDNWFNSPALQVELLKEKTYCLGTTRPDRKNMPKFDIKLNKMSTGSCEVYTSETLMLERWKDRRQVCMLSTFMNHGMTMSQGSSFNRRLKPDSVHIYNSNMNGMDHIDQIMAPYESLRKTLKWYKKLALHLFDLCVYNSYILQQHSNPMKKLKFKDYIMELINELIKQEVIQPLPTRSIQTLHLPIKSKFQDCVHCKIVSRKRKQTPFRCSGCAKQLCIDKENNCFKQFHEMPTSLAKRRRKNTDEYDMGSSESENYQIDTQDTCMSSSGFILPSQNLVNSQSQPLEHFSFFTCGSGHSHVSETQDSQETTFPDDD